MKTFITALFLIFSVSASAHPGRTDSKGGHTCRTNCKKWGLEYNQYHYHQKKIKKVKIKSKKTARKIARQK